MKLGDIVEGWCVPCKLNLDMNVAAVEAGIIKQVQCRTCGDFVAYKPPVDMEKKRAAALKKLMKMQEKKRGGGGGEAAPKPVAPVETQRWKKLTADVDSRYARPYDPHRTFKPESFILHKKHGMGHVESADEGEIIVLFRKGLMTLEQDQPKDE